VLIFNLATEGAIRIDQERVKLRPGEGVLILPYQFHAFAKPQREEILWLIVTFECDRRAPLEHFRGTPFHFGVDIRRRLVSALELYAARQQESGNQMLALEIACLLAELGPIVRKLSTPLILADRRSHELLNEIEDYLRQSQPAMVRIQDIAQRLHVSESRLRTRFRAAFGSSLGQYLRNYRLHVAIDRMRDTRRNFTQIANDLGFPDSATFTRFVRCQTGFTPSEFRRGLVH
jgi:AraC-like DNA-binding protein